MDRKSQSQKHPRTNVKEAKSSSNTTKKTDTNQESQLNEKLPDMWEDPVFVSRQKELNQLSQEFSKAIDKLVVEHPLHFDPKLLDDQSQSCTDSFIEEEEEDTDEIKSNRIGKTIHEKALLLMFEIDQMRKDTYRLISYFRPNSIKHNARLMKMKSGLENLVGYLDSLRMRAECLLCP